MCIYRPLQRHKKNLPEANTTQTSPSELLLLQRQQLHSSITIPAATTTIHELQTLSTMEIHFTLCCLRSPEAIDQRMPSQDQDTLNGTLTPHGTLAQFLYTR